MLDINKKPSGNVSDAHNFGLRISEICQPSFWH